MQPFRFKARQQIPLLHIVFEGSPAELTAAMPPKKQVVSAPAGAACPAEKRAPETAAEPERKAARLEGGGGGEVPVVRAAPTRASEWPRWVDPSDDAAVETYEAMKRLVPWLRQELPAHLKKLGHCAVDAVEAAPPLAIQTADAADSSALSSYKEVWTPANCKVAIETTGLYEASGSLMWLDPGFIGDFVSVLHAEPAWSVVVGYQQQFFSRDACAARQESPEASSAAAGLSASAGGLGRLLFPCSLEAYTTTDEERDWS